MSTRVLLSKDELAALLVWAETGEGFYETGDGRSDAPDCFWTRLRVKLERAKERS